jgi:Uma2 family endonuclease
MGAVAARPVEIPRTADQRVFLTGLRWSDYEILLAVRGDRASPRMAFYKGTVELMSPSFDHEAIKSMLARLLEMWSFREGIRLRGVGSWTVRSAPHERGIEPDECYILGKERKERPDLAIEVVWTSGGLDKLEIYRGLDVPEVWLWESGTIAVWVLTDGGYLPAVGSRLLPTVDLAALARCATIEDPHDAIAAFLGEP